MTHFPQFWAGFWRGLLSNSAKLGVKKSRLVLVILVILAGIWAGAGIHPSWAIALVVTVYSMERLFAVVILLIKNREQRLEHVRKMSDFRSFIESRCPDDNDDDEKNVA